jgi:hypothetical protein
MHAVLDARAVVSPQAAVLAARVAGVPVTLLCKGGSTISTV